MKSVGRFFGRPWVAFVSSALLLTLAFPPFNLFPFLWIALVPLLSSLVDLDPKRAWRLGYLFGLVFALGELHWLYELTVKWTSSLGLGLVPWLVASVLMPIYFGMACWLMNRCSRMGKFWLMPLVWAGIEVFRSYIPVLAFPWGLIASPLYRLPAVIQPAHFGSIYLISAWVVGVNLAFALLIRSQGKSTRQENWISTAALAIPLLSIGMFFLPRPTHPLRVTIGQTGIDMAFETDPRTTQAKIGAVVRQFVDQAKSNGSKMLVLPEGIAHGPLTDNYLGFKMDPAIPTLFGAERVVTKKKVFQSAVGFDGQWHSADKTRLVIFGEFVPARDYLPLPAGFNLPAGDLSAGENGVQAMQLGGVTVGPLLCFEGLFPDLGFRQSANGASFLAVMSIDDWFMTSSAPDQLRGASIWRAVETGLPVARAASLGYSLACDGKGQVISSVPIGGSRAFAVDLPVPDSHPASAQLPVFPGICFALVVALLFLPLLKIRD